MPDGAAWQAVWEERSGQRGRRGGQGGTHQAVCLEVGGSTAATAIAAADVAAAADAVVADAATAVVVSAASIAVAAAAVLQRAVFPLRAGSCLSIPYSTVPAAACGFSVCFHLLLLINYRCACACWSIFGSPIS